MNVFNMYDPRHFNQILQGKHGNASILDHIGVTADKVSLACHWLVRATQ